LTPPRALSPPRSRTPPGPPALVLRPSPCPPPPCLVFFPDHPHPPPPPVAGAGHEHAIDRIVANGLWARVADWRKQGTVRRGERRERDVERELDLEPVADMGAGGAHRHFREAREETALLRRRRLGTARPRQHGAAAAHGPGLHFLPQVMQRPSDAAGLALRAIADDRGKPCKRFNAARHGMGTALDDEKCSERAEHHAAAPGFSFEYRRELALQCQAARFAKQQQV